MLAVVPEMSVFSVASAIVVATSVSVVVVSASAVVAYSEAST